MIFDSDFSPITNFNSSLGDLTYLTSISATDSTLNFSQDVTLTNNLNNLTSISINTDGFSTFPNWFFTLPNLVTLSLDNMEGLNEIPSELGSIESLTSINIVNGYVTSFPASLPNLTNLRILNQNNEILIISDAFCERNETDDNFTLTLSDDVICEVNLNEDNILTSLSITNSEGTNYAESITDFDVIEITIEVPFSADVSSLTVTFEIPENATSNTISPLTHDFETTNPLEILITASTNDQRDYEITLVRAEMTDKEALLTICYDCGWSLENDEWAGVVFDENENVTELEIPSAFFSALITFNDNFWELTNLQKFTSSYNLPEDIEDVGLPNLTELYITNNANLTSFPQWVINSISLNIIDFSYSSVTEIPDGIGSLSNLTDLKLNNNNVSSISNDIEFLDSLAFLDLSVNSIALIPDSIGGMDNLEDLNLYFNTNTLYSIPASIANIETLTSLNIDANANLLTIPKEICDRETAGFLTITKIEGLTECELYTAEIQAQRDALLAMLTPNEFVSWDEDEDMSDWLGITVDDNGNVIGLDDGYYHNIDYESDFILELKYLTSISQARGEIPENIFKLTTLESYSNVPAVGLTIVPDGILELENLKEIRIEAATNLEYLPENIHFLTNLNSLSISVALVLSEIPENIVLLQNLESLSITNTSEITTISDEICEFGATLNTFNVDDGLCE